MTLVLNGTDGLSDVDGTAATPAIRGTDANTGIFFPAADTIAFSEGGVEAMRIDSSGNVGIGTSSPIQLLTLESTGNIRSTIRNSTENVSYSSSLDFATGVGSLSNSNVVGRIIGLITQADPSTLQSALTFHTNGGDSILERMRIDSSGNLQFNSGYGSVAVAYGCRAWVNFNGTGTVAIRASGNVTSVTDNGTGRYTVNFTTAMPDANYSVKGMASLGTRYSYVSIVSTPTTSGVAIIVYGDDGSSQDCAQVHVSIVR